MDRIYVKDISGRACVVSKGAVLKALVAEPIACLGMTLDTIAELRNQYLCMGGKLDMSPESVREVFAARFPSRANEEAAADAATWLLYDRLPTQWNFNYEMNVRAVGDTVKMYKKGSLARTPFTITRCANLSPLLCSNQRLAEVVAEEAWNHLLSNASFWSACADWQKNYDFVANILHRKEGLFRLIWDIRVSL